MSSSLHSFKPLSLYDVVIVGAGAAGIGVGTILQELGVPKMIILDRDSIGASFKRWPKEMRFITPSFNSAAFGLLDLNAIALETSPANFLQSEHPSGKQYASYLETLAKELNLPIETEIEVQSVETLRNEKQFRLTTNQGTISSRFVIWAAGEFQYPNLNPFPGAADCIHTSQVSKWESLEGTERIVIGAFESGLDAAVHLAAAGKLVTLLNPDSELKTTDQDPSNSISPFTRERFTLVSQKTGRIHVEHHSDVIRAEKNGNHYRVTTRSEKKWESSYPPILATGFKGSTSLIQSHFDYDKEKHIQLTKSDESTKTTGLFLVGPEVRQSGFHFCYIYKFRQRFALVAEEIAKRLHLPLEPVDRYKKQGMYLDDLSCCGAQCFC